MTVVCCGCIEDCLLKETIHQLHSTTTRNNPAITMRLLLTVALEININVSKEMILGVTQTTRLNQDACESRGLKVQRRIQPLMHRIPARVAYKRDGLSVAVSAGFLAMSAASANITNNAVANIPPRRTTVNNVLVVESVSVAAILCIVED
jgi:hypothetical protein